MTVIRSNATEVAAAIAAKGGPKVMASIVSTTQHYGMLMHRRVLANASGRPGPRVITGDYRRSITLSHLIGPGVISSQVGTNKVQAWRLEKGFTGTDSAGRVYDQPPYEHFGSAYWQTAPEYLNGLGASIARELSS